MDALTHKAKCYAMNSFAYYFKDGIDDIFTYQNYISSGIADAVFIKRLEVNKEIKIKAQRKSLNILKTKYREWVDDLTNIIMDMTETYKFKKFDEMRSNILEEAIKDLKTIPNLHILDYSDTYSSKYNTSPLIIFTPSKYSLDSIYTLSSYDMPWSITEGVSYSTDSRKTRVEHYTFYTRLYATKDNLLPIYIDLLFRCKKVIPLHP